MFKTSALLFSLMLLTSCSFYKSAGRKQFESKAPASIQAFSLQSCRELSAAETWLKEEFPSSTHELVEMNQDYEVWGKGLDDGQVEVTVFSKTDNNKTESCIYRFESKHVWQSYKQSFLDELSRSLVDID
ncbi:hypothetical protein [Bdellovibrio sp. HCB337]|uniref:hypothetical protein n=1 Tax=Bdellovibrio sp. HCB337 TaxID=3394358 RepID=UPI0039A60F40